VKIFKFGGASVKDADSIKNVAQILQREGTEHCLLVISAMGKMTNAFEKVVEAYHQKIQTQPSIDFIYAYHQEILKDLFSSDHEVFNKVEERFDELHNFLQKNTSRDYDHLYDQIVCFGELLSTIIVSQYLNSIGIENTWNDVRKLIQTDSSYRDAKVDWKATEATIRNNIDCEKLNIVQGFLGGDSHGNTTTLGREGSDYTAGIFAYCLDAQSVTIWKDVKGFLNADPRVFDQTKILRELSYNEAIEMAFYGASVIHPKTIQPLQRKEIPLFVRSFLATEDKGTLIFRNLMLTPSVSCFILKRNQILISISSKDFNFMNENKIGEVFQILYKHKIKVNLIQNSAISLSVCVEDKYNELTNLISEMGLNFRVKRNEPVSLFTMRHASEAEVNYYTRGKKILLKQQTRNTFQFIYE
jgi:aspartate kinase